MDDIEKIESDSLNEAFSEKHSRHRVRRKRKPKDIKMGGKANPLHILIAAILAIMIGFFIAIPRDHESEEAPTSAQDSAS
jgi:hypothetical protein